MAIQFTSTAQASSSGGVKALVYSEAGIGKTMLCATMPSPVLLSAESGLLSLSPQNITRVYGADRPDICYNIPVIQIASVEDLQEAYTWAAFSAEAQQVSSIGIDSISEIAEVVLNNAKRTVKDPRQAYGELIERMESIIRAFRDLPGKNVYMAAKMEMMKDEVAGTMKYGPSMPGSKLGQKLPYFFDEVFRLGVNKDAQGNSFRFLQTQPDLQYMAKDRSGALAAMEEPHLGKLFAKAAA